jgi:hypothetical protein
MPVALDQDQKLAQYAHPERLVTTAWLAEHLEDPDLVLLHVGEKGEYEAGHIPGALSIPVAELRRRLGGTFTTDELVELYERDGTAWCLDVAVAAAPSAPWAWDMRTVADAAFARYLREAADFAGGRRLE